MHVLGLSLTVVADGLPDVWWKFPCWCSGSAERRARGVRGPGHRVRLRQLGFGYPAAIGLSRLLRGSYHLYQGLGGFFVGNLAMGLLFGPYRRWGRVTPLVVAHTLSGRSSGTPCWPVTLHGFRPDGRTHLP